MAHFAKIENNLVTQIIVVDNADCNGGEYPGSESIGQDFISNMSLAGEWMQTSYNKNFRGNFAGIGYSYDESLDAFIPPKPYPSWVLVDYNWKAPVDKPINGEYVWNEDTLSWDEIV